MNITVIIVNYRTPDHVVELLPSLADQPQVSEIVLVDNDPVAPFFTDLPGIKIKTSTVNLGFGAAINLAMEDVSTDWVLLINPDVRLDHDCISALIDAAELTGSPLLGPRFYWDNEHQFRLPPATGGSAWFRSAMQCASKNQLERALLTQYWTTHHDRFWNMKVPFSETYLSGACMLADRSRLSLTTGDLMDPDFFLYFEDTDLCARTITRGFQPMCVPQAEAVHFWNQSPEPATSKADLFSTSAETFFHKHFGSIETAKIPGDSLQIECENLGMLTDSPTLDPALLPGLEYCELALNNLYLPFTQADITDTPFCINDALWQNMAKGNYHLRARSRTSGLEQRWVFQKN